MAGCMPERLVVPRENSWHRSENNSTPASTGEDAASGCLSDWSEVADARAFCVVVQHVGEGVGSPTEASASDTTARA